MTADTCTHLQITPDNRFTVKVAQVVDPNGNIIASVKVRQMKGLSLVERSDFITHIESQHTLDKLVGASLLTSYHANGTPKRRRNGKLPNTKTFYCIKQWSAIDYNQI